jgi:hypothetical protein
VLLIEVNERRLLTQKTFLFEVNAGTPREKGVRLISLPPSMHFKFF